MLLCVFLMGTLIGSFLCLASDRYHPWFSFYQNLRGICRPSSQCNHCHHPLRWFELLPLISYLLLKGQCRYCRQTLPAKLILFEYVSGIACMTIYWLFPDPAQMCGALLCYSLLVLLGTIDWQYLLLPDVLVFFLLWSGLLLQACFPLPALTSRIAGVCLGYLSLFLVNAIYRCWRGTEGIGGGDMKLLAALGAWCGWQALPKIVVVASLLTIAILCRRRNIRSCLQENIPLPFGTFLSVAGWIYFMFHHIVNFPPAL